MVPNSTLLYGLNGQTRTIVDATASGTLLSKSTEEAFRLLEEMSANNCQWPGEKLKKAAWMHEVDSILSLSAPVSTLAIRLHLSPPMMQQLENQLWWPAAVPTEEIVWGWKPSSVNLLITGIITSSPSKIF